MNTPKKDKLRPSYEARVTDRKHASEQETYQEWPSIVHRKDKIHQSGLDVKKEGSEDGLLASSTYAARALSKLRAPRIIICCTNENENTPKRRLYTWAQKALGLYKIGELRVGWHAGTKDFVHYGTVLSYKQLNMSWLRGRSEPAVLSPSAGPTESVTVYIRTP
jgi:hypothetical protein